MSGRKEGWYWCVMDGALLPIYYSGGMWWKGSHRLWEEPRIISGRIPTPEERWQTVPVEAIKYAAEVLRSNAGPLTCEATADGLESLLAAAPKPEDE